MPRRLGEEWPLRAVGGSRRHTSQRPDGPCPYTVAVGYDLLGMRNVDDANTGSMAKAAIDVELIGALPCLFRFVYLALGLMIVLMVAHMLRLSRSAFMHAIRRNRGPAELER